MDVIDLRLMGIYKITNKVNNKVYIGSSNSLYKRKREHFSSLNKDRHFNIYLQRSWNKYGEDNFDFDILELVLNESELEKREDFWMNECKSFDRRFGYNIVQGASRKTYPLELRNKISRSKIGRKLSQETKDKISKAKKGIKRLYPMSDETKKKISDMLKGRNDYVLKGGSHPNSILQERDIETIINLSLNTTVKEISSIYNVNLSTIYRILNGESWKSVSNGLKVCRNKDSYILNEIDVINIKIKLLDGESCANLARKYMVDHSTILLIKKGKNWRHVLPEINLSDIKTKTKPKKRKKLTIEDVVSIKGMISNGVKIEKIAEQYSVTKKTIYDIRSGKYWSDVK